MMEVAASAIIVPSPLIDEPSSSGESHSRSSSVVGASPYSHHPQHYHINFPEIRKMKKQTSNEPMVIELNPWVDADTQHCTLYCCRSFSPHEHSTSVFNQVYVGKFQTSAMPDPSSSVQTTQQSKVNCAHRFFVQVEHCETDQSCHVGSKTNMNVCVLMNTFTTTVQQLIDRIKKVKQLTHCKHLTQMYFVEHLQQLSKYVYIPVPNDVMLHTVLTHYLWDSSKPADLAAKPDRWVLGKAPNHVLKLPNLDVNQLKAPPPRTVEKFHAIDNVLYPGCVFHILLREIVHKKRIFTSNQPKNDDEFKHMKMNQKAPILLQHSHTILEHVPLANEKNNDHIDDLTIDDDSKHSEYPLISKTDDSHDINDIEDPKELWLRQHSQSSHHSNTVSQTEIEFWSEESKSESRTISRHTKYNSSSIGISTIQKITAFRKKRGRAETDMSHSSSSQYSISSFRNIKPPKKVLKQTEEQQIANDFDKLHVKNNSHLTSPDMSAKPLETASMHITTTKGKKYTFYPTWNRSQSHSATSSQSLEDPWDWKEQSCIEKQDSDWIKHENHFDDKQEMDSDDEPDQDERVFNPNPTLFNDENDQGLGNPEASFFVKTLFNDFGNQLSSKFQRDYRYKYVLMILVMLCGPWLRLPQHNITQRDTKLVKDLMCNLAKCHGIHFNECEMLRELAVQVSVFHHMNAILYYLKIQAPFLQKSPFTLLYETLMYMSVYGFEENQYAIAQVFCRLGALLNIPKEDTAYMLLLFECEFHLLKIYRHVF